MKKAAKIIASVLAVSLLLNSPAGFAKGTKKTTVKQKKMTMKVGSKKKIELKNKKKKAKYRFKLSKKKIVRVSSNGRVKALKAGTVKITVYEIYKKKKRKAGVVQVTCINNKKKIQKPDVSDQTQNSSKTPDTPSSPSPTPAPSNDASPSPAATQKATPTPKPPVGPEGYVVPGDFDTKKKEVTYGTVEKKQYDSTTTKTTRNVNIILPAHYSTEKKYPVLYLLHGIGGDENEWLNQGRPVYILGNLVAEGLAKEMITVIPNCRARENDKATTEYSLEHYAAFDNFINDLRDNLMPYMKKNYSIATGRENTAIAGLSMGGRESLYIGLNMPETFGYIAAFSPGYGVFAYTANGVSEKGLFTEETFRLPDAYKDNTLLLINNGISEGGENAIGGTCHKVLEKNGIPHQFYVTTGGHDFKVWKHGLYNFAIRLFP